MHRLLLEVIQEIHYKCKHLDLKKKKQTISLIKLNNKHKLRNNKRMVFIKKEQFFQS